MICLSLLKKGLDILKIKTKFIHSIIDSIFYKKNTETFTDFLYNISDVYDYNKYTNEKMNESNIKMEDIPDEIFEDINVLSIVLFTIYNIGLTNCLNVKLEDNDKVSYPINYAMRFSKIGLEFARRYRENKNRYDVLQYELLIKLEVIRYVMTDYNDIVNKNNLSNNILDTTNCFLTKHLDTIIDGFNESKRES